MNNNRVRGLGLGRGLGRGRGMGQSHALGRVDRYLDEERIRELDIADRPIGRGGMRLRDGTCRMSRFDGRGLRLRDGSCRFPDSVGRGMYYPGQRTDERRERNS